MAFSSSFLPPTAPLPLYGSLSPALVLPDPTVVFVSAVERTHRIRGREAAGGIFWRPRSSRNRSCRPLGAQSRMRAILLALLLVVGSVDRFRPLKIITPHKQAVKLLCEDIHEYVYTNFSGENGDLVKLISERINLRGSPIVFDTEPQGDKPRRFMAEATLMASRGLLHEQGDDPKALPLWQGCERPPMLFPIVLRDKVSDASRSSLSVHESTSHRPWRRVAKASWTQEAARPLYNRAHRRSAKASGIEKSSFREQLANAPTEGRYWELVKKWKSGPKPKGAIPLKELASSFQAKMNGAERDTTHFDWQQRDLQEAYAALIPDSTADDTPERTFSRPFSDEEVDEVKRRLATRPARSSVGMDEVTYRTLRRIESSVLVRLFDTCVASKGIPSTWLYTTLVALLKPGKPKDDVNSYRIVALESCFLKMLTLLIDIRIREWCLTAGILPDTQNGFRPRYRTNNNVHILRTAVDQARRTGKKLYAAFVDLANAFPTVHRATLWFKMFKRGAGGPLFDWLRELYATMKYSVRGDDKYSETFRASLGILIGDPASPIAFLIYMSDFSTFPDAEDIYLDGAPVPHLEHADDLVLLSTTMPGLQRKLDRLGQWAAENLMVTSVQKSWVAAFCHNEPPECMLNLYGAPLPWKTEFKYVGINLSTNGRTGMFPDHYIQQAKSARKIANTTLYLESRIGHMDPVNGRKLYLAQIDPHLTSGCDVCIDDVASQLKPLQNAQQTYLRRIIGLSRSGPTVFLFTELGLWPIAYRRLSLALSYLEYLRTLPEHHLARHAAVEAACMANADPPRGWFHALKTRVQALAAGHTLPDFLDLTPVSVNEALVALKSSVDAAVTRSLADLDPSRSHLATAQLSYDKKGRPKRVTLAMRHYLTIHRQSRRRVMMKLMLSDHELAIEAFRRVRPKVDRHLRVCRLCGTEVETPEHILFSCSAPLPPTQDRALRSLKDNLRSHFGPQWGVWSQEWKFINAIRWHSIINEFADVAYLVYKYTISKKIVTIA